MTMPPTADRDAWRRSILSRIRPRRTALLVIDVQNDFCSEGGALAALGGDVSSSAAVAHAIDQFLPSVRGKLAFIAFFRLVYDPLVLTDSQRERLLRDGRPPICAPDGPGSELFVQPGQGDFVFTKHRYSAFSSEAFVELLRERDVDTVAVTGVDTHICVEGTVRHGYDLGYRMLVLSDLVGTRRSEWARHESSLALCERYFGLVLTRDAFLAQLGIAAALPDSAAPEVR